MLKSLSLIIFFTLLTVSLANCEGNGAFSEKQSSSQPVSEYERTRALLKKHKQGIYKIVNNSRPEVKAEMLENINLCLQHGETVFLQKTRKGKANFKAFTQTIDFFVAKLEGANGFVPDERQIAKYNELRALLQRDRSFMEKYIYDNNPKFNHTDLQRQRLYDVVLHNDIHGYLAAIVTTEQEFENNFSFLVNNWESLSSEIRTHYSLQELMKEQDGGSDLPF